MQKIESCGGEQFALVALINYEKPVEEEEEIGPRGILLDDELSY